MIQLESYLQDQWRAGKGPLATLVNATTEEPMAEGSTGGLDFGAAVRHAREVGGPALRSMSFRERAGILKALATALHEHREELISVSIANAGTPRSDAKFDIDGATGTLAWYGRLGESLGERSFLADGDGIQLGRTARFWGQHILVPRHGVAVHINAFNFPAWNMWEKAACALLAGMPVIEKPGTPTALLAFVMAKKAIESGAMPAGAFQFVCGSAGDLLDHLGPQDAFAFTGSATTGRMLRGRENILEHGVHTNIEADSLNAAVLAPDADPSTDAFALFVRNVVLDMRQKTGQKCTAVRRVFVPAALADEARAALLEEIGTLVVGDPADAGTRMGPLASKAQLADVRQGIGELGATAKTLCGGADPVRDKGFFVHPTLLEAGRATAEVIHELEVFGPVQTLMTYDGTPDAAAGLVRLGRGSLVSSLYSNDADWIEGAVLGLAPWNGRIFVGSDKSADQSVPPGTVLPQMIHGGPGRAGGGEELGGLRGLALYLQRTAVQGFKGIVAKRFGPTD